MAQQSKKTEEKIRRLRELHRDGASAREIAGALEVSTPTCIVWHRDMGLEPNGSGGSARAKFFAAAGVVVPDEPEVEDEASSPPAERPPAAEDTPESAAAATVAEVCANARRFSRIVERMLVAAEIGEQPAKLVADLIDAQRRIAAQLVALVPPKPPDPAHDPTNLQFAAETRTKFRALVDRAEEKTRCRHCGNPPFAAGKVATT